MLCSRPDEINFKPEKKEETSGGLLVCFPTCYPGGFSGQTTPEGSGNHAPALLEAIPPSGRNRGRMRETTTKRGGRKEEREREVGGVRREEKKADGWMDIHKWESCLARVPLPRCDSRESKQERKKNQLSENHFEFWLLFGFSGSKKLDFFFF